MPERDNRSLRTALLLVLALWMMAAAAPSLAQEKEAEADWKPVTLLYMSDVKGKIEPCG
jgi:hypothetical protein